MSDMESTMEMMAQLPLLQEAPDEAQANLKKEGPVMALMSWEWHELGAASFDFLAIPPDFNHSKRLSQLQLT